MKGKIRNLGIFCQYVRYVLYLNLIFFNRIKLNKKGLSNFSYLEDLSSSDKISASKIEFSDESKIPQSTNAKTSITHQVFHPLANKVMQSKPINFFKNGVIPSKALVNSVND